MGSAETSSFKQIIRDVESLVAALLIQVDDEEDHKVSGFEVESPEAQPALTNGQKLALLMKSPSTRSRVSDYLMANVLFGVKLGLPRPIPDLEGESWL